VPPWQLQSNQPLKPGEAQLYGFCIHVTNVDHHRNCRTKSSKATDSVQNTQLVKVQGKP
jgi:hypothetical protein